MANKNSAPQAAGVMGELQSEISTEAAPLLQFITRHVGIIVGLVLALILAIVVAGVYQWYTAKTVREAHLSLGKVLTSTTGENRIQALEALMGDMPQSMHIGIRLEMALAALEAEKFDKAAEAYGQVAGMDNGPIGVISAMNQADMLLKAGNAEASLSVLEGLERTVPENMRIMLLEHMGIVAEAAGNAERAIKAYEALVAAGTGGEDVAYYQDRIRVLRAGLEQPSSEAPEQSSPARGDGTEAPAR